MAITPKRAARVGFILQNMPAAIYFWRMLRYQNYERRGLFTWALRLFYSSAKTPKAISWSNKVVPTGPAKPH
jgi:hypothetical protein